jgi:hypothetical protein
MITYLVLWCYLLIQGMAHNTGVLPLEKGRALQLKNGQKLKLGDAHVNPRNIQEVQASKVGDAPEAPLLHRQKSSHLSTNYILIASCIMRFSWSVDAW